MTPLSEVEKKLGYFFKDKNLLKRALTLSSADSNLNNETFEFFGDAILEFIVSERIFDDKSSEGNLTERRKALVSDDALTPVSIKLGLDKALIRGSGDTRNKKAIPSVYESVVAAIYLDGGMGAAKKFVFNTLDFDVRPAENNKGELQEFLQSLGEKRPVYTHKNVGTEQSPRHMVELTLFGKKFSCTAEKIKDAEQTVAKKALEHIDERGLRK